MLKQYMKIIRLEKIFHLLKIIREKGIVEGIGIALRYTVYKAKKGLLLYYFKLQSKNNLVLKKIQGRKMYLDISDPGISEELLLRGVHEELSTQIFQQEIKRGMTIIDIGANLGYYVLLEASIAGEDGQVFAFEPVPANFNLLCNNIKANDYKNVKVYCKAISSKKGISKITLTDQSNWGTMLDMKTAVVSEYMKQKMHKLARKVIEVDAISLDEFLHEEGVNQVNFIRMDIEGHEDEAIKGMSNALKKMPAPLKLFFEIHNKVFDNPKATVGPLLEQLLSFGFMPKYIILSNKILCDINKDNFVSLVCSYKFECPHIFLEK